MGVAPAATECPECCGGGAPSGGVVRRRVGGCGGGVAPEEEAGAAARRRRRLHARGGGRDLAPYEAAGGIQIQAAAHRIRGWRRRPGAAAPSARDGTGIQCF